MPLIAIWTLIGRHLVTKLNDIKLGDVLIYPFTQLLISYDRTLIRKWLSSYYEFIYFNYNLQMKTPGWTESP